jgi:hypothetical protein
MKISDGKLVIKIFEPILIDLYTHRNDLCRIDIHAESIDEAIIFAKAEADSRFCSLGGKCYDAELKLTIEDSYGNTYNSTIEFKNY